MSGLDRRIAELATAQHGVLTCRQLRAIGVADGSIRHRIADRRLRPLFRGVYVLSPDRPSLKGRWMGATLALGDDALLSHFDAPSLWGLSSVRDGDVHVTVPGRHAEHQPGIRAHRIRNVHPDDRAVIDGIPVTSVARTLLDMAAISGPTQLRRLYERAERLEVLDVRAVRATVERHSGHHGARRLTRLSA